MATTDVSSSSSFCSVGMRRRTSVWSPKRSSVSDTSKTSRSRRQTLSTPLSPRRSVSVGNGTPATLGSCQPRKSIMIGPLKDLVIYVEVFNDYGDNRSDLLAAQLHSLGATTVNRITAATTHVVFKAGRQATFERAKIRGTKIVNVLWVQECLDTRTHVCEESYDLLASDSRGGTPTILGKLKRAPLTQTAKLPNELDPASAERLLTRRMAQIEAQRRKAVLKAELSAFVLPKGGDSQQSSQNQGLLRWSPVDDDGSSDSDENVELRQKLHDISAEWGARLSPPLDTPESPTNTPLRELLRQRLVDSGHNSPFLSELVDESPCIPSPRYGTPRLVHPSPLAAGRVNEGTTPTTPATRTLHHVLAPDSLPCRNPIRRVSVVPDSAEKQSSSMKQDDASSATVSRTLGLAKPRLRRSELEVFSETVNETPPPPVAKLMFQRKQQPIAGKKRRLLPTNNESLETTAGNRLSVDSPAEPRQRRRVSEAPNTSGIIAEAPRPHGTLEFSRSTSQQQSHTPSPKAVQLDFGVFAAQKQTHKARALLPSVNNDMLGSPSPTPVKAQRRIEQQQCSVRFSRPSQSESVEKIIEANSTAVTLCCSESKAKPNSVSRRRTVMPSLETRTSLVEVAQMTEDPGKHGNVYGGIVEAEGTAVRRSTRRSQPASLVHAELSTTKDGRTPSTHSTVSRQMTKVSTGTAGDRSGCVKTRVSSTGSKHVQPSSTERGDHPVKTRVSSTGTVLSKRLSSTTSKRSAAKQKRSRSPCTSVSQQPSTILDVQPSTLSPPQQSTVDQQPSTSTQHQPATSAGRSTKRPPALKTLVMTSLHTQQREIVRSVVRALGGFRLQTHVDGRTTHVVCLAEEPRRTINMLRAMLIGCWVVTFQWVTRSVEVGRWLPEEGFEATDAFALVRHCRLQHASMTSLFSRCGPIYVSNRAVPPAFQLQKLVRLGGGTIASNPDRAKILVAFTAVTSGSISVSEQWLLDSISKAEVQDLNDYNMLE